ncbi:hypothetical protein V500_11594 [Pseudogymnoascus sp. VKM F-4518 (FW-2643)]|nr:hypothetical protein V500_11594 [Pseudogymnoascus sp. VKM F-4518 (FW-2643)]
MSSPAHRRQKSSVSGTPKRSSKRSSQAPPSSPPDPSAAQLLGEAASSSQASRGHGTPRRQAKSSSPMNFQSSPVAGRQDAASPFSRGTPDIAMTDGDRTPRASGQLMRDSSPIRYASTSSPGRDFRQQSDAPTESSGLFLRSTQSIPPSSSGMNRSSRGDINPDRSAASGVRRRIFLDENGKVVRDVPDGSDAATFSNNDPTTSDADALGGGSGNIYNTVWGTNISVIDASKTFEGFLRNFTKKYRMWADGLTVAETQEDETSESKVYMDKMKDLLELAHSSLHIDFQDLKAYPPTLKLHHQAQAYPQEMIPLMDQVVHNIMVQLAEEEVKRERAAESQSTNGLSQTHQIPSSDMPIPSSDRGDMELTPGPTQPTQPKKKRDILAEVDEAKYKVRLFGIENTINLRDLDPSDMDKMISIKGLVIRTTPIIPDMAEAFFRCQACNHTVTVEIERGKIAEPTQCPRTVCKSPNSMQIVHNRSNFCNKQVIKLQETPDSVPPGQTPHSVSLCAYDDLVDLCKAGDRVEITGIFRCNPVRVNPAQRTLKNVFKTYVDVVHIQKVDKKRMGIDVSTVEGDTSSTDAEGDIEGKRKISEDDVEKIKVTAARPDIYDLLSRSLAPSIFEMDDVKKGILLQLFGGTNKSFEKGGSPKYRGDINILLCGDPSTSKSQLLKYVHQIAPRGVYTSGKGSSAVGLTAYVTRDQETKQLVLESGALVLSDGGVCCIDEFDKMSESTRSVLHEVMEQQTVSIAKAGIITTLNARTSILASANPIGSKYNPNLPVPQNIDLPPTLLSRFDLVYLILDRIDETNDRRLARHLLSMYLEDTPQSAGNMEILPIEFLTSYISYARNVCQPRITEEASKELVKAYVEMRKLGEDVRSAERRITATTRQLESMIRLSEAHAKMRLSEEVTRDDVLEAVRLIKSALKQAATDARTGLIDMSLLTEGTSASERRRRADLKNALLLLLDNMVRQGQAARYTEVQKRLNEESSIPVEAPEFSDTIRLLEQEGSIMVVGEGPRKSIRRVAGAA